jgi:cyclohexa-1,5-dienecarbonyl-CoA hydratase
MNPTSQAATKFECITLESERPIARITLKNPPGNVIDISMMEELTSALAEIESQPEIFTIVLQGDGKNFSAGVDVAAHSPDSADKMLKKFHGVIRALVATRKVTIAVVHGNCLGGGAELAMMCDIVLTADDATWGFPEISLGCYPPVAATALSALIGPKRASDMILTGGTILGAEASDIGLATRATPQDKLEAAVTKALERLQKLSPAVLALAKKAIYTWDSMHFDKGLTRAEKIYLEELIETEDAQEGIKAFLQKRNPEWTGK